MHFRLKRLISIMFLFACVSTSRASGLPEDPNFPKLGSLMSSVLVGIKNVSCYPFLFVRQWAIRFGDIVQIDHTTVSDLVELFRITGGY